MNYQVYIHIRLDTNEPFYVGKGKNNRPYNFIARNKYWKNIFNKCNGNIRVEIIYKDLYEEDALLKEREIEFNLKESGFKLTNIIETGLKGSTGHKKSLEWKEWYSKFISNINKDRILTEEHKQKLSISNKNFGERLWLNGLNLGRKQSLETCLKKNNKLKGRKQSLEEINKRILSKYKSILQYDLEGNFIKEWPSIKEASEFLDINKPKTISTSISFCCKEKQKTAYGFKWKYKNII